MGNYRSNYNSDLHLQTNMVSTLHTLHGNKENNGRLATGQDVVCSLYQSVSQSVSQNVIRKGRGSLGLNFRANIENLPPAAGGRGRGGSKQELVKSLIVLQSVSTVLTEARSGRALLRRIQNEDRSGKCFMTKQQQHRDSLRETNAAKYPQVFTVGLSPANSIIWKR